MISVEKNMSFSDLLINAINMMASKKDKRGTYGHAEHTWAISTKNSSGAMVVEPPMPLPGMINRIKISRNCSKAWRASLFSSSIFFCMPSSGILHLFIAFCRKDWTSWTSAGFCGFSRCFPLLFLLSWQANSQCMGVPVKLSQIWGK